MSELTKAELQDEAKELGLTGVSSLNKDDLQAKIDEAKTANSDEAAFGEAEPVAIYSDEEAAEAEEENTSPVAIDPPSERPMVGALSDADAEAQEEVVGDLPEDFVGEISESGELYGDTYNDEELSEKDERELTLAEKAHLGIVRQEDIIDFPPPVGVREEQARAAAKEDADEEDGSEAVEPDTFGVTRAKAVLQTDGNSGVDQNLGHAYALPDQLKSNDADELEAAAVSDPIDES